jgi:hypothetical protein
MGDMDRSSGHQSTSSEVTSSSSRRRVMGDMDRSSGHQSTSSEVTSRRSVAISSTRNTTRRSTMDSSMHENAIRDVSISSIEYGRLGGAYGDLQDSVASPTCNKRALGKKLSDSHQGDAIFRLKDEEEGGKWPKVGFFLGGSDHQKRSPKSKPKTKPCVPPETPK